MQTLESQLQAAATLIQEQQRAIQDLSAKTDTQGLVIMRQQLTNVGLQQQLDELVNKIDVIGQLAMQQALPVIDATEGGGDNV